MNKDKQDLYISPEARVVEIKVRQVMCTSNTPMPVDDPFNF